MTATGGTTTARGRKATGGTTKQDEGDAWQHGNGKGQQGDRR
jgi:hypothetical protein